MKNMTTNYAGGIPVLKSWTWISAADLWLIDSDIAVVDGGLACADMAIVNSVRDESHVLLPEIKVQRGADPRVDEVYMVCHIS